MNERLKSFLSRLLIATLVLIHFTNGFYASFIIPWDLIETEVSYDTMYTLRVISFVVWGVSGVLLILIGRRLVNGKRGEYLKQ